jgi:hypothetical protein
MIGGAMNDVDNVIYAPFSVCLAAGFTFSTVAGRQVSRPVRANSKLVLAPCEFVQQKLLG